jgi:diaminohydroxyphosphoribosylaminopyrimidine deaminase / 5-amino-6-(5-phosphoribosylamino)uracil reductase
VETFSADDCRHLDRAIELAERGWGRVHPNPLVGAVLVREGAVVGAGWHAEFGGPHAEVTALEAAGERARGATLYVSLEPCAHHGKTPPCTAAILAAGIRRVVYAAEDPSPRAAGGARVLRAAGVVVAGPEAAPPPAGADEAGHRARVRRQNAAFFRAAEGRGPFVALKLAVSLDGRLGEEAERPTAVTGPAAAAEVHRLRAGFDAILVGIGTALADDPRLTARGSPVPRVPPVRAVVDTEARLPPGARLLAAPGPPVWLLCAPDADPARVAALVAAGARILPVPRAGGGLDLQALAACLGAEGATSVLCEGGGRLAAALLRAERAHRLYLFIAPRFFGEPGPPAFPGTLPGADAGWRLEACGRCGEDALLVLDRTH